MAIEIKKVTAFETSDNKLFKDVVEAEMYEHNIQQAKKIKSFINNSDLSNQNDKDDIILFIIENANELKNILN